MKLYVKLFLECMKLNIVNKKKRYECIGKLCYVDTNEFDRFFLENLNFFIHYFVILFL